MPAAVTKKTKKKKSGWPSDAEIIRDLHAIRKEKQESMERNEPIMVTRFYPDGRRERRPIPGHELLASRNIPEPMSADELRKLRARFKVSQEQFAQWLMVSVGTVRSWEQKNGVPPGPALRLLDRYRKVS